MKQAPRDSEPAKRWSAFLKNHREAIAAMDFFTVPTITFGVLYCFFVIGHDRRRILHVNVTKHPTSGWIMQQLREAFPFEASHKYLIFDRDQKFGFEVIAAVKATRIIPKRTSFRSPWQNGIAASGLVRIDFPPVLLYICAPRALGFVPSRVFMLYRGHNRIQACFTENRPVLVSADVLANHNSSCSVNPFISGYPKSLCSMETLYRSLDTMLSSNR